MHGTEPTEKAIQRPLSNFEGGTNIVGTTQSGKGATLCILIPQALHRGEVVIVIDPKNSKRLRGVVQAECVAARRGDSFLEFHPAFPETAVANEMAQVSRRLFANQYFKGIDALLLLATYRLSILFEWFPVVGVFVCAAWFDGLMMRLVRSKEFDKHSPVIFGLFSCSMLLVIALAIIAFVLPTTVHPLVIGSATVAIGIFGSMAVANFHRQA